MPRRRYPITDHCDGTRFHNPHAISGRGLADLVKWQRTRRSVPWPDHVDLVPHQPPPSVVRHGQVAATFIGHSTFLLRTADAVLVTDPVFTSHAGPFGRLGPRRVRPPAIPLGRLPPADVVLVSHNHYDHLQPSSLRRCATARSAVRHAARRRAICLRRIGLVEGRSSSTGGRRTKVGGAEITAVPAQHFSARTPFDRNQHAVVRLRRPRATASTIYFAGDSGYSPHFAEIGRALSGDRSRAAADRRLRAALVHEPVHMNPEEAVRAHLDLGARAEHRHALRHVSADRRRRSTTRCARWRLSRSAAACRRTRFRVLGLRREPSSL